MIVQKLHELTIKNNDIYILDIALDKIIINNNYQSLQILDTSLTTTSTIPIPNNTTIYSVYKNNSYNLMLYCPDNEYMIFINLQSLTSSMIALPLLLKNDIFSPYYYWYENVFILITFNNQLYQYDNDLSILKKITYEVAHALYPSLIDFWDTSKKYNTLTIYPEPHSFIFQKDPHTLGFFDGIQNHVTLAYDCYEGWHDVQHNNGVFMLIYENKVELLYNNNKIILTPKENYSFLKAKFLDTHTIVVLSSNNSDCALSILEIYSIEKKQHPLI